MPVFIATESLSLVTIENSVTTSNSFFILALMNLYSYRSSKIDSPINKIFSTGHIR
jgi:hypothetical protein